MSNAITNRMNDYFYVMDKVINNINGLSCIRREPSSTKAAKSTFKKVKKTKVETSKDVEEEDDDNKPYQDTQTEPLNQTSIDKIEEL